MSTWGGFKKIKRTEITQVAYTLRKSDCSIVINGGICNMNTSGKHVQMAMRILTTGWMRRLWTLQEVLSQSLKVVLKQDKAASGGIVDFGETIMSMTDFTQLLREKMIHSMTMIRPSSLVEPRGSDLITNTCCDEDHPHPLDIMHAPTELFAEDSLQTNIMYCRMMDRVRLPGMPSMENPMPLLRNLRFCYGEALTIN
ncbi:Transporter bos1 [Apiospora arundinis]